MKLQAKFKRAGYADCDIRIRAKGAFLAMVYWATETGPLEGWSPFAAVPIAPTGEGAYRLEGHRAIPPEATHLYARSITPDFSTTEEAFVEIPETCKPQTKPLQLQAAFSVMSDLHLANRQFYKIGRALSQAACQTLLIAGDLTNDGFTEQFDRLKDQIESTVPDRQIFSVAGNHDFLFASDSEAPKQDNGYHTFQEYLLQRAATHGAQIEWDKSGAYAVNVNGVDVIGLQCVTHSRRFVFPEGAQLKWLDKHLDKSNGWHIVMCHAPLLAHNPQRTEGAAYLSRDEELQRIIDTHRKVIFISGHTHVSPNGKRGCVEYVPEVQSLYLNTGSVVPTQLSGEPLMPADWKDGVVMELSIYDMMLEVKTKSAQTGIYYPRGYYRFDLPEKFAEER